MKINRFIEFCCLFIVVCLLISSCNLSNQSKKKDNVSISDETAAVEASGDEIEMVTPEDVPPSSSTAVLAVLENYEVYSDGRLVALDSPVQQIAAAIEADSILYKAKSPAEPSSRESTMAETAGITPRATSAVPARARNRPPRAPEKPALPTPATRPRGRPGTTTG